MAFLLLALWKTYLRCMKGTYDPAREGVWLESLGMAHQPLAVLGNVGPEVTP